MQIDFDGAAILIKTATPWRTSRRVNRHQPIAYDCALFGGSVWRQPVNRLQPRHKGLLITGDQNTAQHGIFRKEFRQRLLPEERQPHEALLPAATHGGDVSLSSPSGRSQRPLEWERS